MKFNNYSFRELLIDIIDNRGRTCPVVDNGIPLIATNCIKNDGLYPVHEKVRYVSQETYNTWFRGHPRPGDMIFVCKGSPGRICWVPDPVPFCIAQDMVAIRADESKVYPKYLFALLRSGEVQNKIYNLHVGDVIPHFKKGDFGYLRLDIPDDFLYQKKVGDTYFDFSQKIETLRRINQSLEDMAQALFKSWFVDFDPVKAKIAALEAGGSKQDADLASMLAISGKTTEGLLSLRDNNPEAYHELSSTNVLFPSAMDESELGMIPAAWSVTDFGAVSECFDRVRIPLSKRQRELRQGKIPYYGATSVMDYVDESIFDGIYLLLGEDGSVLREDGTPFTQYIWDKAWVNNHAHVLKGRDDITTEQLLLFISRTNIAAYVTGAVQLKLNQKNMNSIPFVRAPREVNEAFNERIASLYEMLRSNTDEIRCLTEIRDGLLPKLLSGEIFSSQLAA